ncbi:MAG: DUF4143 domain-containing protein [Cytophagia bacterium]|nr:MAG: DUF4143 domain-containing protein [Runella sp.]TAG19459.1 MAG: DUF4143 domain-containing protein [Cytophagales bacterium]TAG38740.1 MAG: DUF4143 domain-containing protein [Cytophagia bacterium]TAG80307.1 MAG: DUF4143 domain-containing protein [Cytophagales bacterium]
MVREKLNKLVEWKHKSNRKPLILNGARQVGKSWLIREFGRLHFEQVIEINFEKNLEYHQIFKTNLDPRRILREIALLKGKNISAKIDLLFFDEIQMCPEALMALRYFYEEMPDLHLIAAGSLLDFTFRHIPFPVGRVEFETLHPMTFAEFLMARNRKNLLELIKNEPHSISDAIETLIYDELQNYFVVGGMPECIKLYCENEDFNAVSEVQHDLMYSFRQDFRKYQPQVNSDCLLDILENTSKNIGNQTIYSKLTDRFTGPTIKQGHQVLCMARLLHKIENVGITALPLVASGKQFKTFFLDIGLLLSTSKFNFREAYINKNLLATYEGKLAEQFVAQQLMAQNNDLKYWARTEPAANAEIDFVILENNEIMPVEVKAGTKGSLKSLHYLLDNYKNITSATVFGKMKFGTNDKINFKPMYMAGM